MQKGLPHRREDRGFVPGLIHLGDLSANNLRGGEEMKILPVVFRRVAEQQEIKRQRFFQDGLVVVYLSIRALGPGEEDAVAWFRRIESRVVDDNWERESFCSQQREITKQPWDIRGQREDLDAVFCLLDRHGDGG